MPFNFATGEMTETPAASAAPVSSAPTGKFNFATGEGGSKPTAPVQQETPNTGPFAESNRQLKELADDPFNLKTLGPNYQQNHDTLKTAFNESWESLKQNAKAFDESTNNPNVGFAGRLGSEAKVIGSAAGVLFSPVTALFKAGDNFPVIGSATKGISTAFSYAGEGGRYVGEKIIDQLPIKNQEEKQTLKEGVGDIFALAAQIALGKATEAGYSKLKTKYGAADAQTIIDKATELAESHPDTPERLEQKVKESAAKVQNPEVPIEQTKVNAAAEAVAPKTADEYVASQTTPEGFREVQPDEVLPNGATTRFDFESGKQFTDAPLPKEAEAKMRSEFEKQQTKPSATGQSIEQKAIEAGLTKGFEGTAEYDPITIKNQAERISQFITDKQKVTDILKGTENLPDGVRAGAFIKAVEDFATKNKDVETLENLAKSHLVSETSLHAQELRLLRERDPNSVLNKVKDIEETRKAKVEKIKGPKEKKNIDRAKSEVKKEIKSRFGDANALLEKLIC